MSGASSIVADVKKKARIEIIPLIDVIFFLLATFVLFTLSLNKIASLPVDLPKSDATPRPPDPNDPTVYLQISDEGNVYWKKGTGTAPELITTSEIRPRLADYKNTEGAKSRVLIQGDLRAKFGAAVHALDEVRLAGITQVSVQTTVQPTGK
ncbi:MAG: biopolymer transporter ExbD [Opitutus sp.]|nr:biopolymer transporter ExbD [Opitutus sp.]